ncbi:efflux RND transporter periplasmic adaptor subunit [Myxosarcina sp. GI1(2024)]
MNATDVDSSSFSKSNRINFKELFLATAVIGLSALLPACKNNQTVNNQTPDPVPVKFATLETERIVEASEFVGRLEAVDQAEIKSEIQGQVKQILVESGQNIEAGQVLLELKPDQTVSQVESARAAVNIAESNRDTALEQLKVAGANRDTAQSEVNLAKTNFERAKFLLEGGVIGEFDYDRAAQDLEAKQNNLSSANNAVAAAKAAISQAEANIAQARAQLDEAQVSVNFKKIKAPISGVLDDIPVDIGDYVSTGETVAKIARNNALDLRISVPSNRRKQLKAGLPVELIDPTTKTTLARGSINFIAPTVDPSSQVILTKARFSDENGSLRDGQYVQARVIWNTEPGITIPTIAVSRQSGKDFVYLADEITNDAGETKPIVRLHPVELGALQDTSYQVIDGLEAGDRVATSNILKLQNMTPVQPDSNTTTSQNQI